MRIVIEALGIDRHGGGRTVVLALCTAIFAMDPESSYHVLLAQPEEAFRRFPNVKQVVLPTRNRFLARLKLQLMLPGWVKKQHIDLVHFTKNLGVFGLPCPYVITLHDLTICRHPEKFPPIDSLYWRVIQPFTVRGAAGIVTVSSDTRNDAIAYYHPAPERVHVAHNAIAPSFAAPDHMLVAAAREKYALGNRYVLHVGSISPKKNLDTLLRAFAVLKRDPGVPHNLVLVGREYRPGASQPLVDLAEKLNVSEAVRLVGDVPDEDLPAVYAGADLFVLPSHHEGFGLVLIEAMACGAPVVAVRSGAVPEIVGESGLLVDSPAEPTELAHAMRQVLENPERRTALIASGSRRRQDFSWDKAACTYLDVYRSCVQSKAATLASARFKHE